MFESNAAPAWINPRKRLKNHDAWKFPLPNPNTLQTQPDSLAEHDVDLTSKGADAHHGNPDDQQDRLEYRLPCFEQSDAPFVLGHM